VFSRQPSRLRCGDRIIFKGKRCATFLIEITLKYDGSTDLVYRGLVSALRCLHAPINHGSVCKNGRESLVLQCDWNVWKCLCELLEEDVYIRGCLRRLSVHVYRVAHDKPYDVLCLGIFLKIIYYICSLYGLKCGCKNLQRIAHCHSGALAPVIYADESVHNRTKLLKIFNREDKTAMVRESKEPKVEHFRISLVDDMTHKQLWVVRFTRQSLFVIVVSVVTVILAASFSLIAFTPLRTFIPGYPDAKTKRATLNNALKVDSLQNIIYTWTFYTNNLMKVLEGEDPIAIDSIVRSHPAASQENEVDRKALEGKDSLLRDNVRQAEQFAIDKGTSRELTIEGMHFFTPLKGVVTQPYDEVLHPYVDIAAPSNSVVMSVLDGTVIGAGWSDDSGYTIQIQHADNIVSVYKHNQKLLKKTGDKVLAGTPIALVGNTGSLTTGEHLHFELWYKGEAVDPTKYINF